MHTLIKMSILSFALFGLTAAAHAEILLETATLGPTGVNSGWSVNDQILGTRFELDETTSIECIGGHMFGNGSFFGAIVELSGLSDLPDGDPIGSDVIYAINFEPMSPSTDLLASTNATLGPGAYALLFGGAPELGASGGGGMPFTDQSNLPDASFFFWSVANQQWFNGGFFNTRFVMANGGDCDGAIDSTEVISLEPPTPVPALGTWSIILLILALSGAALAARRMI
ncbi:MAG: hypothetical protein HKO64_03540 [Xanthomonadales bacterium]|nr:hypothetical protein [Xanthomonadales bacterium]